LPLTSFSSKSGAGLRSLEDLSDWALTVRDGAQAVEASRPTKTTPARFRINNTDKIFLTLNYIAQPMIPKFTEGGGESLFGVSTPAKVGCSGITKTFTTIFAPGAGAVGAIFRDEFLFPPFRGPAEFATRATREFLGQKLLPCLAARVAEPPPDEMKKFMQEDAAQFALVPEQCAIQNDQTVPKICGGMDLDAGPVLRYEFAAAHFEIRAKFDSDHGWLLKQ
jgi:hypothetical protein